ncbi:hypothetical protein JXR01_02100 [Candidatus Kaiserbacteria bacterium]|nr:MAG: hypothetical protein JXR01_02100 [Candidatus Kaiserbacteria bacterium]
MEKGILNSTFFNFLFGFVFILSISLSVVLAVNYYDITTEDLMQAGVSFVLFQ